MRKRKDENKMDMLNGSIWDKIIFFAIPLAASSILQQLFNSADVAVVGQFAGSEALAAVGANSSVINLLLNLFVGLSVGSNVVIARYIGKNDLEKARNTVHTSIVLAVLSGFILFGIGFTCARPILTWMSTPDNIIEMAILYLKIYFSGMPFIMLYNFCAAIFRSKGDTKRPLYALIVAGIVNVILNLFFVCICHMSVDGVAIATVISNVISSLMLLRYLIQTPDALQVNIRELRLDFSILKEIAGIGVPAGLQGMVYSIANVMIQTNVNALGSNAVAASSAVLNYEYFAYFILSSFTQSAVTFIGQNVGAQKYDRCKKITKAVLILGAVCTSVVGYIFVIFETPLLKIFTTDSAVLEIAYIRMHIILGYELLNAYVDNISGVLRGLGHSTVPAIVCILGICGVRIGYIYTIYQNFLTFKALIYVYPISWLVTSVVITIVYFVVRKKVYN